MSEPAVNWHEGMFLRPHHFQAAGRYLNDQLRQSGRWDIHYNWGLRAIDIDADALHNYQFVIHRLEARLRDGTLVRVPEDGALTPIDLRAGLEQQNPLEVSLAIPAVQMGRANAGPDSDGTRFRVYTPRDGVPDENSGQNPRPVQVAHYQGTGGWSAARQIYHIRHLPGLQKRLHNAHGLGGDGFTLGNCQLAPMEIFGKLAGRAFDR